MNCCSANRLTTITQGVTVIGDLTYTYDAAGNRIKQGGAFARSTIPPALATASYNANNQQTVFGSNTLTYDLNGNLVTVTDPGGTAIYTWNARNQLASIAATGFAASFAYDSFGRRTGKTIQGATTNFVYDGLNPVQEKNGGTVTANLLTGLGIDEFLTRIDGVGTSALLPDALGSTVALGDGTGTIQTQYTYEPFGYATQTGAANTNSYKYTGREDDGSGLYYYRARYYHPRLQRFISEDPIGFRGGAANLYGYVLNRPIVLVDPSGNIGWGSAVVGAALGALNEAMGASLQNASVGEMVTAIAVGGVVGGAAGFWGIESNAAAMAGLQSLQNLAGQMLTDFSQRWNGNKPPCRDRDINWSGVISAGLGGATTSVIGSWAESLATASPLVSQSLVPFISSWAGFGTGALISAGGARIGSATGF